MTLCSVLAFGACAFALRVGNLDEARRTAEEAAHLAEKHALNDHLSYALAATQIISLRRAGANASLDQVRTTLERWRASQWHVLLSVADFAEAAAAGSAMRSPRSLMERCGYRNATKSCGLIRRCFG